MKKKYLGNLDKNYFVECIDEIIKHYEEAVNHDEFLQKMQELSIQISGLRDVFWIFSIDDILELKEPVIKKINEMKPQ